MSGPTDEAEALAALARRLEPGGELVRAWSPAGGISSRMTVLEVRRAGGAQRRFVLRRPSAWALEQSPRAAAEEFRLLRAVRAAGLPVPEPLLLDESGELLAEPFLVLEFVEGAPALAPADGPRVAAEMGRLLAGVHGHEPAELGLPALPDQQRRAAEWIGREPASVPGGAVAAARAVLESAWPLAGRNAPALLHGDFWPGNLLWRDRELVAIIDWEDAAIGDPLADLAISRLDVLWAFGVEPMEALTRQHAAATGVDATDLPYWDLFAALRCAPHLDAWAAGWPPLGRADVTARVLRRKHGQFLDRALEAIAGR